MSKKLFAIIGMTTCILLAIAGITIILQENMCSYTARSGMYDSGLTTFGADFYTYSNNNAAEAASAAIITANNIYELYDLVSSAGGWLFVFAGAIGFCHFGVIYAGCNDSAPAAVPVAPAESYTRGSVDELKPYPAFGTSGPIGQEELTGGAQNSGTNPEKEE